MLQKKKWLLLTFYTTAGVMAMERACKASEVPGRLIPVPRTITAGCGMCWSAPWESREAVEDLVMEAHLDVDGIYRVVL